MVHFVKCESQINSLDAYWTAFCDSLGGGSTSKGKMVSDCCLRPIVTQKRHNADQHDCGVT